MTVEAVREAAGMTEHDTAAAARAKLAALAGPGQDEVVERVASAVGLSSDQFSVQELFWGIRRLFKVLASRRPLVVTFEDLHWAEDTFLELVDHLVETLDEAPVFLLYTARTDLLERRPQWAASPRSARIVLEALSDDAAEQVVANLLGDVGLDDSIRGRIVAAAEGNPLFVEQLLSMMIDEPSGRGTRRP